MDLLVIIGSLGLFVGAASGWFLIASTARELFREW